MKIIGSPGILKQHSHLFRQLLCTIPSCLIAISSGISFGITAVMLPQLRVDQNLDYNATHESWIASVTSLSMIIGSLSCGHILDHYGRRKAHIILGLPYVIGWIIIACAPSTAIIILGRFFTGLSTGSNKAVTLVYIGEIASPKIRTVAMIIPSILLNVGVLLSHIFGYYLYWKISCYICVVPAALITVSSLFLKESPLWLITKGKIEEGVENFRWFRGTSDTSETELKAILERQSEKPKLTAREMLNVVCSRAFIKPMLVLFVIMLNIQFSGIRILGFYSQDIFRDTFSGNVDPFMLMIVMDSILGIVSTVVCLFVGKYMSKKKTYVASNFGVFISITAMVSYIILGSSSFLWLPVLCLIIYLVFATVILTISWTFLPELLPNSARGLGSGFNSAITAIAQFSIVKVTPDIMKSFGASALFGFYGLSSFICGVILCFTLPETDGKTLQSIEDSYNKKEIKSSTPL